MVRKHKNKLENNNLWHQSHVILHFSNSSQHHKATLYLYKQNKANFIGSPCKFLLQSEFTEITWT